MNLCCCFSVCSVKLHTLHSALVCRVDPIRPDPTLTSVPFNGRTVGNRRLSHTRTRPSFSHVFQDVAVCTFSSNRVNKCAGKRSCVCGFILPHVAPCEPGGAEGNRWHHRDATNKDVAYRDTFSPAFYQLAGIHRSPTRDSEHIFRVLSPSVNQLFRWGFLIAIATGLEVLQLNCKC